MTSDAPDRIWLEPACCADPQTGQTWCKDDDVWGPCEDGVKPTPYLRATPARARAEELVEALRDVLRHMPDYVDTSWINAAGLLARIEGDKL